MEELPLKKIAKNLILLLEEIRESGKLNYKKSANVLIDELKVIVKDDEINNVLQYVNKSNLLKSTIYNVVDYTKNNQLQVEKDFGLNFSSVSLIDRIEKFQLDFKKRGLIGKNSAISCFTERLFLDLPQIRDSLQSSEDQRDKDVVAIIDEIDTNLFNLEKAISRYNENGIFSNNGLIVSIIEALIRVTDAKTLAKLSATKNIKNVTLSLFNEDSEKTFKLVKQPYIDSLNENGINTKDGIIDYVLKPYLNQFGPLFPKEELYKKVLISLVEKKLKKENSSISPEDFIDTMINTGVIPKSHQICDYYAFAESNLSIYEYISENILDFFEKTLFNDRFKSYINYTENEINSNKNTIWFLFKKGEKVEVDKKDVIERILKSQKLNMIMALMQSKMFILELKKDENKLNQIKKIVNNFALELKGGNSLTKYVFKNLINKKVDLYLMDYIEISDKLIDYFLSELQNIK